MNDSRDTFIAQVVEGRSFVDVGGLWGTVNEKVSVAHAAGARSLAMIDISSHDGPLWNAFEERRRTLQLPDVRCIEGNVLELVERDVDLAFDVVHCSGVLYHAPDPLRLLEALRRLTRSHLVLSSSVIPGVIANDEGELHVPDAAALFVPALTGRDRAILRAHWWPIVQDGAIGLTRDLDRWRPGDFGPWWWLPTVPSLEAMCRASGFHVREVAPHWRGYAATLLLEVA